MVSEISTPLNSASYSVLISAVFSIPNPLVEFPWGSQSTKSIRRSFAARDAARFTAVVVLPTPPFWFEMAITLDTCLIAAFRILAWVFHVEHEVSTLAPGKRLVEFGWPGVPSANQKRQVVRN